MVKNVLIAFSFGALAWGYFFDSTLAYFIGALVLLV